MPTSLRQVTQDTFAEQVLRSERPVVVEFWASWSGRCKQVSGFLPDLVAEHGDRLDFAAVNVDEAPQLVADYDIRSLPTFLVFKHGEVVKSIVGPKPQTMISSGLRLVATC